MLSQLGHVVVGLADSIMVGQVGTIPLAGASFANAMFYFPLMFGIGVTYGITPHVATADGKSDQKGAAEYLKHGMIISLILGILLILAVYVFSKNVQILDQPKVVLDQGIPYLLILAVSILPVLIFQTFRQFAEGLSFTKLVMTVAIGSNVLNIVFNYILIFGKLGFEPMGLLGAGYATLLARIIMAVWIAFLILKGKRFQQYWDNVELKVFDFKRIKEILNVGVPAGLQFVFEVGAFSFTAIMVGWIGAPQLAAHQIAMNLSSLTYMAASGIAAAATIRVGNQFGRKDIQTLREAGFTSFITVILFMTAAGLIFIIGRKLLPSFYVDDEAVITVASSLMIVAALFQLSDGIQVVGLGALRGIKDVKIPTIYAFIAYWLLGLPIGYLLGFKAELGAQGVWLGLLTGLSISALLNGIRFNKLSKKLIFNEW